MRLKNNVRLKGLQPQILIAVMVANDVYRQHGKELVITSVNDSKHGTNSIHYKGNAVDLRTHYFDNQERLEVYREIKSRLIVDFDVVLENNHIHIEYDPK